MFPVLQYRKQEICNKVLFMPHDMPSRFWQADQTNNTAKRIVLNLHNRQEIRAGECAKGVRMSRKNNKELSFLKILLLFVIHLVVWGIYALLLVPVLKNGLGGLGYELVGETIKLITWTMPAVFLVRHYSSDMFLTLREMLSSRVKPMPYVLLSIGTLAYCLVSSIVVHGNVTLIRPDPLSHLIGTVLLVGITEEVLFRGFFLNALLKKTRIVYAHGISSLMFVAIHLPWWIYSGSVSDLSSALFACASIFILGFIFGWVFMKSRNIFIPIFLHMLWNLLQTLFVVGV